MTDVIQGSEAWLQMRCGKVTASRVADIMAKTKSGPAASRANYMAQLIAERLTGTVEPSFTNAAMQWGTEKEPLAREAYKADRFVDVVEVAFVDHPTIAFAGASPDGLVGSDGLIEIKCPNTATHIDTLLSDTIPSKYKTQMAFQMTCTGRQWCDFVSFDPRMPPELQLFIKRYEWDAAFITEMEHDIAVFLAETAEKVENLKSLYSPKEAT